MKPARADIASSLNIFCFLSKYVFSTQLMQQSKYKDFHGKTIKFLSLKVLLRPKINSTFSLYFKTM